MHGIPVPAGDTGKIELTRWFNVVPPPAYFVQGGKGWIAFAPFAGFQEGLVNVKALTIERAQAMVDGFRTLGLDILQVGDPREPDLEGCVRRNTIYSESVRRILGCRAMVMGDSGLAWVLSGYDFPLVGLYGNWYHGDRVSAIQPVNPNARYLVARTINEIPVESVIEAVKEMVK